MYQSWRDLLWLHWSWEPAALQERLPAGLHVDTHDGRAWVGLVPFRMTGVRFRGLPALPVLSSFAEMNVRTCVHDERGTPGVWFFSLDAESALAVRVARRLYRLPYHHARMDLRWDVDGFLEYGSRRRDRAAPAAWFRYRGAGPRRRAEPGTIEFFLVERYVLFAAHRGRLYHGRVHHDPYELQPAECTQWSDSPLALTGLDPPRRQPDSALFSAGVDVRVWRLRRPGRP
jgi:hypothetical protein